ncbi:amidohydrolase family protein [Bacteroidota bacterium]
MKLYLTFLLVIIGTGLKAQIPIPAKPQTSPVALMNGVAHLGDGKVIDNSIVAFENGKLSIVVDARSAKVDLTGYEVVNIDGKHVYPGLILPNSAVGLVEIGAIKATLDYDEVGILNPNVRSLIAYNADSEIPPALRFNGVLLAQVVPSGGLISGSSSIMMMDGWNWEDAAYLMDDGIHVRWPEMLTTPRWRMGETEYKPDKNYEKHTKILDEFFSDAAAYSKKIAPADKNLKLEAMRPVLDGKVNLYIHADGMKEIIDGVNLAQKYNVKKIVIVGAADAWYVRKLLKENNIPVLLTDVHRLPQRDDEDVDMPYKLPGLLTKEGILVGLTHESPSNSRNLGFYAGTAATYSLGKEEALKLVTSNTAQILGIDNKTGMLVAGLDANLVVSDGDLLDMRSNNVTHAYIQGRKLNLESKHQWLYQKYKEKYEEGN